MLNIIIERGILMKDPESKTLTPVDTMPDGVVKQLLELSEECLKKAGLIDGNEKLRNIKDLNSPR